MPPSGDGIRWYNLCCYQGFTELNEHAEQQRDN